MSKNKQVPKIINFAFIILGFLICLELTLRLGGTMILSLQEWRNQQSLKEKGTYKILCLGDSMTALGGEFSYPRQLEQILNEHHPDLTFSVINKGIPGNKSTYIVQEAQNNISTYKPDMVIVMMGANDEWDLVRYEKVDPLEKENFLTSLKTYKLGRLIKRLIFSGEAANKMDESAVFDDMLLDNVMMPSMENQLADQQSDLFKTLDQKGRKLIVDKEYEQALHIYKELLNLDEQKYYVYFSLGSIYLDIQGFEKAEEMFKLSIDNKPDYEWAYSYLAKCYGYQKRFDESVELFNKTLEVNPQSNWAYYGLVWSYRQTGNQLKIIESAERAIKVIPENGWFYGVLASHYRLIGRPDMADYYYAQASQIRRRYNNALISQNFRLIKEIIKINGLKMVAVQYPMRVVDELEQMLGSDSDIVFVDNEMSFKEALRVNHFTEYFTDLFGGDFGHCTKKGNYLLASNVADALIQKIFK